MPKRKTSSQLVAGNESNPASKTGAHEVVENVIQSLSSWETRQNPPTREIDNLTAHALVKALQTSQQRTKHFIAALKLNQVAHDGQFFLFLRGAAQRFAWGDGSNSLWGYLWANVFNRASEADKLRLLDELIAVPDFFQRLYGVPSFLIHADISASALAPWLGRIQERIGNDGLSGVLWKGLDRLAEHRPNVAVELVQSWTISRPENPIAYMAASMLGRLRAVDPTLTNSLDEFLGQHPDEQRRFVFHRSWSIYDQYTPLRPPELALVVSRMAKGTPKEVEEAFHCVRCALAANHRCDEGFIFGVQWLHQNVPSAPSETWTHWIACLARICDERVSALGLPLLRSLVPRLLPIKEGNKGTWDELEQLLMHLLGSSREEFGKFLFEIFASDSIGVLKRFSSRSEFNGLRNLMRASRLESLVCNALTSLDVSNRRLGLMLFEVLFITRLPSDEMALWHDDWLAALIFQFQKMPFYDEVIPRFLVALLPRVEQGSERLRQLFGEELLYQMKNLPGICLEPLKKLAADNGHELLRLAVKAAEEYFEKLRPCYRSAINSMGVEGFLRSEGMIRRRRSKQMSEAADKSSPFLGMCSTSYSLYGGKRWQSYTDGNLGEVGSMSDYSHSMEYPRLPTMDPDGHAQRQNDAYKSINVLVRAERERREVSDASLS